MPTYTNSYNGIVQLKDITFGALETKILYNYIDLTADTTGYISLTSHAPYWNPILSDTNVTGTGETVEVTLSTFKSSSVHITYVSGDVTVYLNSTDNTPGMTILENVTLDNRGKIYKLYVVFVGAGEIQVQENL
jgi:hypothetical protein